jgi:hypothetical protein
MMIRFIKVSAALLVVSLAATAIARAADKRPNILFIIADDQSPFDFKTYNTGPRQACRRGHGLRCGLPHGLLLRSGLFSIETYDHERPHPLAPEADR